MNISLKEKKAEAINRMKSWGIFPDVIKQFEKDNLVSESAPPVGACFWLNEDQKKRVSEFEKNTMLWFIMLFIAILIWVKWKAIYM